MLLSARIKEQGVTATLDQAKKDWARFLELVSDVERVRAIVPVNT
jgi:hypothetical protein